MQCLWCTMSSKHTGLLLTLNIANCVFLLISLMNISALLLCICFMLLQLLTTVLDLNVAIFYVKVV